MRRTATAVVTGHWRRPLVRLRFVTALTIVVFAARFALVGADAALWPQGGETGAPVRVAEPGDTRPVRHVFRVVKERGDFVDVESLGAPAHGHCEDGPMGLHEARLRFTVARRALVPVITRATTVRHGDGSSVRLPVSAIAEDVRVSPADVGTTYVKRTLTANPRA